MNTYDLGDWYVHAYEASEKLLEMAETEQDCISALCTLSGAGRWETAEDGRRVYNAPVSDEERTQLAETGVYPVETYAVEGSMIPTRVAQHFGLGEKVICGNAGDFLQGDIINRPIYWKRRYESGMAVSEATTLQGILKEDGDEDVWWKPVEWRHIQAVVDGNGRQTERFKLVSAILQLLAFAEIDAQTFIPYGEQFADSDFIDSF